MNNIYYVYELQYPDGTPFYIGKGKGDRCYDHLKGYDTHNKFKTRVINKIRKIGGEPIVKIVEDNLAENKAFGIEQFLVGYYGRRDIKSGILTNLSSGGEGCSGWVPSEETRRKIGESNKKSTKQFIYESNKIHGLLFDYSLIVYINNHTNIIIVCSKHGKFEQSPSNHLRGQGCPNCGKEKMTEAQRSSTEEFVEKSNKKHNNFYDYSKTEYGINNQDKVTIICSEHGDFKQTPANHLKGSGCQNCKNKKLSSKFGKNHHMYGKYGKNSPASKKVNQYDKNKNYIKTWNSATEVTKELNIVLSSISLCCNGKRKSAGGFIWRYV